MITVMALALLVAGCSSPTGFVPAGSPSLSPSATSPVPTASWASASPSPVESPLAAKPSPTRLSPSLEDYFDQLPPTSPLSIDGTRERTSSFTSYDISYLSDGFHITGVINVPEGDGPFPTVVLAHGWIDRDDYVAGQGMTRERNYLAEHGYIALHVDYRGHAGSDDDPELVEQLYLGYAVDVLGAIAALRTSDLPVDDQQIALMGRSMGGSVVLQALEMAPGLVKAGIIYSAQSTLESENYQQWGGAPNHFGDEFAERHGTPSENPRAWEAMSTRPYFSRITEPVLMIHGTRDEQCPPRWAEDTFTALIDASVDVRLNWYDGERHAFESRFTQSMQDSIAFISQHLP